MAPSLFPHRRFEIAVAPKRFAANNSPLPGKTVAKNRSSRFPRRLRSTPMNFRNAMPAKGNQVGSESDRGALGRIGQPRARTARIGWYRKPHDPQAKDSSVRKRSHLQQPPPA